MKGSYDITVRNNRVQYHFTIYRNITILRGDSATGKTTLIEMIDNYVKGGSESGIEVICPKPCVVLERGNWERDLKDIRDSIVFIDEGNGFVQKKEFAGMVRGSSNYFVIATRDSLFELPYSITEVYGIRNKSGNRYQGTKRLYSEFFPLYNGEVLKSRPDKIIIEDSNSAFQFFSEVCKKENIICESAAGKSNLYRCIRDSEENIILVIADGAAFGAEMERALSLKKAKNVVYFLPESFEWLILKSGIIKVGEIKTVLNNPSEFIESERYFSWERFFTSLLVEKTRKSSLAYSKQELNKSYLHVKTKKDIVKTVNSEAGKDIFLM